MSGPSAENHTNGQTQPNRGALSRRSMAFGGGGGLALAALALGSGRTILAQEATPEAGLGGRYGVIRVRKLKPDYSGDELTALVREGFLPKVEAVTGFVSYAILWNAETRDWASIGIFADKAGAEESNAVAAAWGEESGAIEYTEGDPVVIDGTVVVTTEE